MMIIYSVEIIGTNALFNLLGAKLSGNATLTSFFTNQIESDLPFFFKKQKKIFWNLLCLVEESKSGLNDIRENKK